jgi:hypothetical protein
LPDLVLSIANQLLPHPLLGILASKPLSELDPINFLQELTLVYACEPHLVKFFLGETLEKGVRTCFVQGITVLLVVFLVVGVRVPIGQPVQALKLSSVGLLILKLKDFRVVNTIATLESTKANNFVNGV